VQLQSWLAFGCAFNNQHRQWSVGQKCIFEYRPAHIVHHRYFSGLAQGTSIQICKSVRSLTKVHDKTIQKSGIFRISCTAHSTIEAFHGLIGYLALLAADSCTHLDSALTFQVCQGSYLSYPVYRMPCHHDQRGVSQSKEASTAQHLGPMQPELDIHESAKSADSICNYSSPCSVAYSKSV